MIYEFKLPDIGEGLTEGEVVKWHVQEGQQVSENQPLLNVLTDKAEVEIPSPKTGIIVKLMAKVGDKVQVHGGLVTFEVGDRALPRGSAAAKGSSEAANGAAQAAAPVPRAADASVNVLPAIRKLAGDLKVDLSRVQGTGSGGRITEDDVRKASSGAPSPADAAQPGDEKIPFIGIRRRTAEKMSHSLKTAAHVTHMDEADFTALVALREELKPEAAKKGVKLTYLPFVIRALVKSLKEFPDMNSTLDEAGGSIIRRKACNIGIATDSPTGLVVPVVKGAQDKDVWGLAAEMNKLSDKVRAGQITAPETQGGTFTITNIGPIGGLFATPIINHPEAAILGLMKIEKRPAVKDGQIQIRDKGNLVLSFDHRVLDGAQAARFMNTLVKHLENPRTLL